MLRLTQAQLEEIIQHAREGAPEEVCGILAGRDGVVSRVLRAANVAPNPRVRYEMDPARQLEIMQLLERDGSHLLGIYHSHPRSPAFPSHVDLQLAYYPDSVYVIVSLASGEEVPVVRAFRLRNGQVSEELLSLVD